MKQCHLLGPFALLLQGILGGLGFISVVYKRKVEVPQRPLKVWLFDISKQIIGSLGIHVLNLTISIISHTKPTTSTYYDACDWYFLIFLFDTTIGVPIVYVFVRLFTIIGKWFNVEGIDSGNYDEPPRYTCGNYDEPPRYTWFFKQAFIYFLALTSMKAVTYTFIRVVPLMWLAEFLLAWTNFNEQIRVGFVMFLFPLVMNMFQYYVIDSLIQASAEEIEEMDRFEAAHRSYNAIQ
ncbi:hypothetical protein CANCADRAFT_28794 [Tortispora caseinolytica NRRL Y-17796]|uniref:Vacuolar membrane protein n=1 Tax=Tortispora caseinolytica NRRL Y-17796 TaxID=767744 RepID=A0A1E4TBA8_9ASCO|nr:hypothetical protein CANCADRAFT_28794 [Tortispora caseinolytica NRRL Y-17796]